LARYEEEVSWDEQLLRLNIDHVIFATGFERYLPTMKSESLTPEVPFPKVLVDGTEITAADYDAYQIDSGEILAGGGRLFGVGIAFPPHHHYAEGTTEPWVGFKRSIQQTFQMIDRFEEASSNTKAESASKMLSSLSIADACVHV